MTQANRGKAWVEKKDHKFLTALFFVLISTINYTWITEVGIKIWGVTVYLSVPLFLFAIGLAVIAFLATPNFGRGKVVMGQLLIILLPILFELLWSHVIWIVSRAGFTEVRRAYSSVMYLVLGLCTCAALAYAAGESAWKCHLGSLLAASTLILAETIRSGGLGTFLSELATLLATFGGETGAVIGRMEIHGIVYAEGAYLVYFLMRPEKMRRYWPMAILAAIFFLIGLKRIAFPAIAVGIFLGYLFVLLSRYPNAKRFLGRALGAGFLVFGIAYAGMAYFGGFAYLENLGIDTKSRAEIYRRYASYISFSPAYLGKGLGWVFDMYQKLKEVDPTFTTTHNEYFEKFIELGMVGSVLRNYLNTNFQVSWAYRKLGGKGGDLCLALAAYIAVIYLTDQVYAYTYMAVAAILMSERLTEREREKERELENANQRLCEEGY